MAGKIDFKVVQKQFYNPQIRGFHYVEIPEMQFLMIDGVGDPNKSQKYAQAIEALYSMSYGIKFAIKRTGQDYIVPPLEGLWWMEDMHEFSMATKDRWEWTMMVMQPEWVSSELVENVRLSTKKKKPNPLLDEIRFTRYSEGLCVQILYTGAYSDEASTISQLHNLIHADGYQTNGKHHEIYLGDVRKTPPEKLKTILRQPVMKCETIGI